MKDKKTLQVIREELKGKKLFVIPYMHADWAWCHTREWHVRRYLAVFEDVIRIMQQDIGYKWYMDCFRTALVPVLERKPSLLPDIRACVEKGDLQVAGTFVNVRPNLVGDEAYVRNMIIGRKKFEACFPGVEILVHGDSVDVALGHPQLPQLIRKGGYRFFRAGRPYEVLEKKGLKREFIWEGLDGSRVLAWWGTYGGLWVGENVQKLREALPDWESLVRELYDQELQQYQCNSNVDVIWVAQGCDDVLPLKAFNSDLDVPLPEIIQKWNEHENSQMCFAGSNDFFLELEKQTDRIEVHKGTVEICDVSFNVAWGGERGMVNKRLKSSERLCEAELWQLIAQLKGGPAAENLQNLWEESLTASAHATAWLFTQDFDEIQGCIDRVLLEANRKKLAAQRTIVERMSYQEDCIAVAFNGLDEVRQAVVRITVPTGFVETLHFADGQGNRLPHQLLRAYEYTDSVWEYEVLVQVQLLPLGWTQIRAMDAAVDCRLGAVFQREALAAAFGTAKPFIIDNGVLRLSFKDGRLCRITDLETGEDQPAEGMAAWNDLVYTEIDTDNGALHAGPTLWKRVVQFNRATLLEEGPIRWRVRLEGSDGLISYTQEITLEAGSRNLQFRVDFQWPESRGRLASRIPITGTCELRGGIPFGSEKKDVDAEPYSDCEWSDLHREWPGLFCAKDYVRVVDGDFSSALINVESDRFYRLDREARTLEYILLNSTTLIENSWEDSMNVKAPKSLGSHSIAYGLHIGRSGETDREAAWAARMLRSPVDLVLPYVGEAAGTLPGWGSMLRMEEDNLAITAFYADGETMLLRFYETDGKRTQVCIHLDADLRSAVSEDFIGRPDGRPVTCDGGTIRLQVEPHEIVTLRLTVASGGK